MTDEKQTYRLKDIARLLDVSPRTLRYWRNLGIVKLPPPIGGKTWSKSVIDDWVDEQINGKERKLAAINGKVHTEG